MLFWSNLASLLKTSPPQVAHIYVARQGQLPQFLCRNLQVQKIPFRFLKREIMNTMVIKWELCGMDQI